ncbi:rRNA-processing protein FYV7 [Cyberlindnera jadinii]|uniref:rRNA-processing protein FYV7 n=1 Tax=Cyberlindnera jadinii (strain ATCC 18201 / CBS 1600 / BCRC 20928 / JCM 3617 / NBRC 0987 / NRRL Y-1542) TaxID=983966 RepID=A0A0H5CDW0_CYBJN|nr:rRNA processing [Cyberlindnera jadinii NRRL Y-1542]ODV75637.1 rRNA processing [Cyberlindnera jadinii NRRL Y-1542]CEP22749.1 rRNA-processing protein FYV7 [Cyberlindnera jadinii]
MVEHKNGRFQKKKNPYLDRRESKNREIRQALTHKARLKRKYLKELERSGESVPDKEEVHRHRVVREADKGPSFQERQQIAKERKKFLRELREKEKKQRMETVQLKREARDKKKELLSQKTRTGQPLMGPRINNLLEKIQKQYGNDQ